VKKPHPSAKEASLTSPQKPASTPQGEKQLSRDVVLLGGPTEDKKGLRVLRARDQSIEVGEVRPLSPGQPIYSDVVRLHPRKEAPFVCDVETTYAAPQNTAPSDSKDRRLTGAGPAQVASRAYRDNWDAIWSTDDRTGNGSQLN